MSTYGRTTANYYRMISQKSFTAYQVLEIFASIVIGGLMIYGGLQLQKDQDIINRHSKESAEPFNNTLGWVFIVIAASIILLGLYRLFMKGEVAA